MASNSAEAVGECRVLRRQWTVGRADHWLRGFLPCVCVCVWCVCMCEVCVWCVCVVCGVLTLYNLYRSVKSIELINVTKFGK